HEVRDNGESHRYSQLHDDDGSPEPAELRRNTSGARALDPIAKIARNADSRKRAGNCSSSYGEECGIHERHRRKLAVDPERKRSSATREFATHLIQTPTHSRSRGRETNDRCHRAEDERLREQLHDDALPACTE